VLTAVSQYEMVGETRSLLLCSITPELSLEMFVNKISKHSHFVSAHAAFWANSFPRFLFPNLVCIS